MFCLKSCNIGAKPDNEFFNNCEYFWVLPKYVELPSKSVIESDSFLILPTSSWNFVTPSSVGIALSNSICVAKLPIAE